MLGKHHQTTARFLFRFDVSPKIGVGHLRRCMVLAKELKFLGASVFFACRSKDFDVATVLASFCDDCLIPIDWSMTPEDDVQEIIQLYRKYKVNTAVIDHYSADEAYQRQLYEAGIQWLQFDGCIQQHLWADWVLNPSPASKECNYHAAKQRDATQFLLGPTYSLLRDEFRLWQPLVKFRKQVRKILLTFGGGDDKGATVFSLEAFKSLEPSMERVVLVSSANPNKTEIENWVEQNKKIKATLLIDEPEIARNMAEADIAIIAGGGTTFEVAAMGLPCLIIQIADNQKLNAKAWHKDGVGINLGCIENMHPTFLERQVSKLINDSRLRWVMFHNSKALVDCLGAKRVAQILTSQNKLFLNR